MSIAIDAQKLAELTHAEPCVLGEQTIERFVLDSREAGAGSCFVAVDGERVDGNDFALGALRSGASAVLLTRPATAEECDAAREAGASLLAVDDAEQALLAVAGWWRREHPEWTVVGVTGSNGKTTTKDMCAAVLSGSYRVHATQGNHNNRLGLPLTVFDAPEDTQILVLEMGMNSVGEIDDLATAAAPQFAVITNVGTAHIGMLGSREGIARAKAELVGHITDKYGALQPNGAARLVLSGEDDFAGFIEREFAAPEGIEVLHAGWRADDDLCGAGLELDEQGRASFMVATPARCPEQPAEPAPARHPERSAKGAEPKDLPPYTLDPIPVHLSITGRHAATDALFATAVGLAFGVPASVIAERLATLAPSRMRQELLVRADGLRLIDDSYNASPESMAGALQVLASMSCSGQRVAVLGEMGEQGDAARDLHRLVGAYAAAVAPDLLVIIGGELADAMADAALTMGLDAGCLARYDSVPAALEALCPVLGGDDLVCVKASRSAGLDAFSQGVLAYVR